MKAALRWALIVAAIALAGCALQKPAPTATPLPPAAAALQGAATPTPVAVPAARATATTEATATSLPATVAAQSPAAATQTPAAAIAAAGSPIVSASATRTMVTANGSLTLNGTEISYMYPAGWSMNQQTANGYSRLTFDGPDGALLTLAIDNSGTAPAQLSATLLDTLTKRFKDSTATPLAGTVAGAPAQGYTLAFSYNNVPMTATILSFQAAKLGFTLYTQAADVTASAVQPGFDVFNSTLAVK